MKKQINFGIPCCADCSFVDNSEFDFKLDIRIYYCEHPDFPDGQNGNRIMLYEDIEPNYEIHPCCPISNKERFK
jgi:hypothetical protein